MKIKIVDSLIANPLSFKFCSILNIKYSNLSGAWFPKGSLQDLFKEKSWLKVNLMAWFRRTINRTVLNVKLMIQYINETQQNY